MEIIDVHVHGSPHPEKRGEKERLDNVIAAHHEQGIRRFVLIPMNDVSQQPAGEMNIFTANAVSTYPDIAGFIDLDLSQAHSFCNGVPALEKEIAQAYEQGLRGIKVHPQNLGVDADDWRLLPVYRLAGELGIPVMVHCYPGPTPLGLNHSHPEKIQKVVRVFHRTTFVLAHLGGIPHFPLMAWLSADNVYFDTAGVMKELWAFYSIEQLRYIFSQIGYDRLLFGSDYPYSIAQTLTILKEVVPPENQAQVFSENAALLGTRFGWWR
jgi:predicted TIM-barrel fold metal-dependent hydrolase